MKKSEIASFFSDKVRQAIMNLPAKSFEQIQEIRLRVARPVMLTYGAKPFVLSINGGICKNTETAIITDVSDIEYTLKTACEHSIYSYSHELSQCFVTVKGGHRVGIAGTAVCDDKGNITMPKSISSLNFRIASQRIGSANELFYDVMGAKRAGVLIVGRPMSAKTTILRDLSRILGAYYRISLIDERSEIAALHNGIPFCDVGDMTDVFDGYSKSIGIFHALRVMSPQIIICDEIGSQDEALTLMEASKCGVKIIASVHGDSIEQVVHRKGINQLVKFGAFTYAVMLGSDENIGKIIGIKRFCDEDYRNCNDIAFEHSVRNDNGNAALRKIKTSAADRIDAV